MCQLLETIKIKAGKLQNLPYHTDRVNHTRRSLFHVADQWDLGEIIRIPLLNENLIYKCRFLYSKGVDSIEFAPYSSRAITRLNIVYGENVNYSFKYADRILLEYLKKNNSVDDSEDILIVKHGLVTDTSFSNIVFFDGLDWLTPDTPLLNGTKRTHYLRIGEIRKMKIRPSDIFNFEKARLINAMLDLEESPDIPIRNITLEKGH